MRAKLVRVLVLLSLSLGMLWTIRDAKPVHATSSSANVYILIPFGTSGYTDSITQGAIDALTPDGRNGDVPWAHPKTGTTPPYFYNPTYTQVTTFSAYTNLILNGNNAVVLNPWGNNFFVPCGYDPLAWIDKISHAMADQGFTWINVGGGYPFYYWIRADDNGLACFNEGSLGQQGLQELLKPMFGTNSLILHSASDLGLTTSSDSDITALNPLISASWPKIQTYAKYASPYYASAPAYVMKSSDFQNELLMPLYQTGLSGTNYLEGAAIGFYSNIGTAARVSPSTAKGGGALVYLDGQMEDSGGLATNYSFCGGSTQCGYYFQGYVATAAALELAITQAFKPSSIEQKFGSFGTHDFALKVNTVILGLSADAAGNKIVKLGYGIYGGEKSAVSDYFSQVSFNVYDPTNSGLQFSTDITNSYDGQDQGTLLSTPASTDSASAAGIDTLLYIAGLWGPTELYSNIVQGVMLLNQWANVISNDQSYSATSGIAPNYASNTYFSYKPTQVFTVLPNNGGNLVEFQSFIIVDVKVAPGQDWATLPINYWVSVNSELAPGGPVMTGESPVAVWTGTSNTATVFHEDFENGMGAWTTGEDNSASNSGWGIITIADNPYGSATPNYASPEAVGTNSQYNNAPNVQSCPAPIGYPTTALSACYDVNENAWMKLDLTHLNLNAYQTLKLQYDVDVDWMNSGASLTVDFGGALPSRTYQGNDAGPGLNPRLVFTEHFSIPVSTPFVRFRFQSNGDTNHGSSWYLWGPLVDDVILTGTLPSDGSTTTSSRNAYAGWDFNSATSIAAGSSSPNKYYGYIWGTPGNTLPNSPTGLVGVEDWYQFSASAHYSLHATLTNLAPGENLLVSIYDPNNNLVCSGSTCSSVDLTVHTMSSGNWRVRVFASTAGNIAPPTPTATSQPDSYGSYLLSLQAVAIPTLTATFTTSGSPAMNVPVTITASANGGTPPYVYSWTFGDGSTGSGNVVSHAYSATGTFSVTLTVTDADGWVVSQTQPIIVSSFSLTNNVSSSSAFQGQKPSFQVTVTDISGTTSVIVTLTSSVAGGPTGTCPSGAGCPTTNLASNSLTAAPGATNATTITVSVPYGAPCGSLTQPVTYTVTVKGASGTETHTATIQVSVFHRGDVNHDGVVNISDLAIVGSHFGQTYGSPGWDPRADPDGDGVVDITDLVMVSGQFGLGC